MPLRPGITVESSEAAEYPSQLPAALASVRDWVAERV